MRLQLDALNKAVTTLQERTQRGQKISGQEFADDVKAVAIAAQAAINQMAKQLEELERRVPRT